MGEYGPDAEVRVASFATTCGMCKNEREDRPLCVIDVLAGDHHSTWFYICADCIQRLCDCMQRTPKQEK